jgi:rhamnosyltransferase
MMATYNGERYLREQVDSVLAQEGVDVTLRICDDRSSDGTFAICQEYAATQPNVIATQNEVNLGVGKNFMQMVYEDDAVGYDYYAFSDQDDVWMPEKLERAVESIQASPQDGPVLYCSDFNNVDGSLNHPEREIYKYGPFLDYKGNALLWNWLPGCTMVWNRPLCTLLRRYKPAAYLRIHDVWVYLVAYYCATVVPDLDNAYIYRRITGDNAVGLLRTNYRSPREALRSLQFLVSSPSKHANLATARFLYEGYADDISSDKRDTVLEFLGYPRSLASRMSNAFSRNYHLPTMQMRLVMRLRFLFGRY